MLMIYGATGYTGRMACLRAKDLGLPFMIAGRTNGLIKEFAASLGVQYRVFDVDQHQNSIDIAFKGVSVLLNCAGPFKRTAEPLILACIRTGTHYLDIAAELDSYQLAEKQDERAKQAKVMLLPGCGGSVAMLGCLVAHVLERVKNPDRIDIALHVAGPMSRGSAMSAAESLSPQCLQRLDGVLVEQENGNTVQFDFDDENGLVDCFAVTLPDLVTIWKATGVPNIRTFVHVSGDAFPTGDLASLPDGPTVEQREANPYRGAITVTGSDGRVQHAVLHTVNGYTFTSIASIEAASRVLAGEARAGFQTPAVIFGKDFVKAIAGSSIKEM